MYLKKGLVKLFKKGLNNKDQIISIARPLDFVSILTVFSGSSFKYSISALEETIICHIDLNSIEEVIKTNGSFALQLVRHMSRTSDYIIKTTFDIKNKQLRGRIAYILMYFAEQVYRKSTFELPLSRKEIAELIEMTTENVIRVLSEFRKDNIIEIDGKNIKIVSTERLKNISKHG